MENILHIEVLSFFSDKSPEERSRAICNPVVHIVVFSLQNEFDEEYLIVICRSLHCVYLTLYLGSSTIESSQKHTRLYQSLYVYRGEMLLMTRNLGVTSSTEGAVESPSTNQKKVSEYASKAILLVFRILKILC